MVIIIFLVIIFLVIIFLVIIFLVIIFVVIIFLVVIFLIINFLVIIFLVIIIFLVLTKFIGMIRYGPRATVQSAAVSIALPNNQVRDFLYFHIRSTTKKIKYLLKALPNNQMYTFT